MSLPKILEALLFASQRPLQLQEIAAILNAATVAEPANPTAAEAASVEPGEILAVLRLLQEEYEAAGRAFRLVEVAGGWQLVSTQDYALWVRQLYPEAKPVRLSAPALETLAIIAYRQPITRADIEAVRGVAVDGVVQTLLDRGLIESVGRADLPGRPQVYATTEGFLQYFGLRSLEDLPNADELRRLDLPKAPIPEADPEQPTLPLEEAPPPPPSRPQEEPTHGGADSAPTAPELNTGEGES